MTWGWISQERQTTQEQSQRMTPTVANTSMIKQSLLRPRFLLPAQWRGGLFLMAVRGHLDRHCSSPSRLVESFGTHNFYDDPTMIGWTIVGNTSMDWWRMTYTPPARWWRHNHSRYWLDAEQNHNFRELGHFVTQRRPGDAIGDDNSTWIGCSSQVWKISVKKVNQEVIWSWQQLLLHL